MRITNERGSSHVGLVYVIAVVLLSPVAGLGLYLTAQNLRWYKTLSPEEQGQLGWWPREYLRNVLVSYVACVVIVFIGALLGNISRFLSDLVAGAGLLPLFYAPVATPFMLWEWRQRLRDPQLWKTLPLMVLFIASLIVALIVVAGLVTSIFASIAGMFK